ncbi:uncharacterized protein [Diadema antillarum]|uniref:uncharacterized protein n=1 Tax=Diadema antillarum TaxID=105358 RepID=UPI003A8A4F77
MADHDEVVTAVHSLRQKLCADPMPEERQILKILRRLDRLPITVEVLQETGIGKAVNKLRRCGGDITVAVKGLIHGWKELVRKAMEAERQMDAEAEHSPAAEDVRDEDEEEGRGEEEEEVAEEEEGAEEEEEDQGDEDAGESMDEEEEEGDGESYTGSDNSASQSEDDRDAPSSSGGESPRCDSPPPAPVQEPKYPRKTERSSFKDSGNHHKYRDSDRERTSQKRPHEHSPPHRQHLSSSHSSVNTAKKKRVEENFTSKNLAGPKKLKKSALGDSVPAQDLFQNPHKLGSQPQAPSAKSTSLNKVRSSNADKDRSSPSRKDQQLSHSPAKNSAHGSKLTNVDQTKQKKANAAGDAKRPEGRSEGIVEMNGNAKRSGPSVSVDGKPPSSQNTSKSKSTAVKAPSKKPSLLSVNDKLKTESTNTGKETKSETHRTKDKLLSKSPGKSSIKTESRPKPSSSVSSSLSSSSSSSPSVKANKSSAIQGDVKHSESSANDGEKMRRRLSSGGGNSGDDEKNFSNTGMSFADCLMGPIPSGKPKKVKRLNNGASAAASTKKVATAKVPTSNKSSSKQATSSSSSSKLMTSVGSKSLKSVQSSSKSGVREPSSGSKSKASGKDKGKVTPREKVKKESQGLPQEMSTQRTKTREEDLHQGITFNLPEISADYKPLRLPELSPKKKVLGPSDEGSYIGSKHARTKVFSGKARSTWRYVPTLFESCMRILLDNIDALDEIGVPYDIIKPILEKCTPQQLLRLEDFNPYLIEDTDPLWRAHADRDFKGHRPTDMESWRELYLRKMDEREERLKNVTANISAAMAKKDPGRLTKMAFVNGPAKPPRNVMRQQVRHGTGRINSAPPSNTHKSYVPSKHVGDRPSSHSLSASTSSSVRSSSGSGSGGGGGGGGGGSGSYGNSPGSGGGSGRMSAPRGKAPKAPMMQKALKMKKLFRR